MGRALVIAVLFKISNHLFDRSQLYFNNLSFFKLGQLTVNTVLLGKGADVNV